MTDLPDFAVPDLIAIGASAGGVDAVGRLLAVLPAHTRAAVVVVLHVPPDRPSGLAPLFNERCALPVTEAEDKECLSPGRVYIAPPDYHLLVEPDRSLSLSVEEAVLFSRPSIDLTFESVAYAYGDRALGIILTGASSDGAQGLRHIREQGGVAWVQQPEGARAQAMPQAALAQAGADLVGDIDALAAYLARTLARTRQ